MRKFFRIVTYAALAVIVFVVLLMGVTQTQFFRDRLRAIVLTQLDTLMLADVRMGHIRGNLVSGFSIDTVAFIVDGRSAIAVERVDLRYNLLDVPGRRVSVSALTLVRPQILLSRGMDGVWNFSRLVRPKPEDNEPAKPFDWPVTVDRLEIQDGTFILADSLAMRHVAASDTLSRHLHDFTVRDINLVLSGRMTPEEKRLSIARLSGVCSSPDIALRSLSGDFAVTENEASVKGLEIVTGRSSVRLTASMQKFDLFGGVELEQLQHSPVSLDLEGSPVNLHELYQMIPEIDFLNGSAMLFLNASGEFGHLSIEQLDLGTGRSRMHWKGTLANLHRPEDLTLAVKMTESEIHPGDLLTLMPPFHLPDFSTLGMTSLALEFDGKPLDFHTRFTLQTSAGSIKTDMAMKIGGPATLRYHGTVNGQNIDLARILGNQRLAGNLNGTASIEGEGVSLETLASTLDAQIAPSEFRGLPVPPSHMHVDAHNRVLTADASLGLGEMTSTFNAQLDQRDPSVPRFAVAADINALNLAPLLHNNDYDSRLTLHLRSQGHGLTWASLGGEASMDFSSSRYREYNLDSGNVHVFLDQNDPRHKQLQVSSNIADVSVTGSFSLSYVSRLVSYQVQNFKMAIGERLASLDSSLAVTVEDRKAVEEAGRSLREKPDSIDAEYSVHIKNLEPVSVVTSDRRFQGNGTLNGSVRGSYRDLALHGLLDAQYFLYGNAERGLLLQNALLAFDLTNLKPIAPLHDATLRLSVKADKLHINHTALDSLAANIAYANEFARYDVQTVNAATASAATRTALRGRAWLTGGGITAGIDFLRFGYRDFAWSADSGATLAVTGANAKLQGLVLRHDTTAVTADGQLLSQGMFDVHLSAQRVNLSDLRYLLSAEEMGSEGESFRGAADLDITGSGALRAPVFSGSVRARGIAFKRVPFGRLSVDLTYADTLLHMVVRGGTVVGGDTTATALTIQGTLPLNLALASVERRLPDAPMNFVILSDGTQMSILDPLLPTFNDLSGTMRCRLTVAGTPRHPQYGGTMSFENCSFLFVPNNIRYLMEASFQPEGERIRVLDATVRNVPADERGRRKGEIHITGDLALRDFRPGDFNLTARGEILAVKENSRLTSLSLYGNLFAEIGSGGLHFTGNIENSLLKGSLIVTNSNLVFPPTQTEVKEESPLSIPVVFVDDTTKARAVQTPAELAWYFGTDSTSETTPGTTENLSSKSFLDGVHYDLDIETAGGNTQIRMIFNAITNEELVANIEGKFNITGDGRQWFGELTVDRAYYNFFKRFNAEGTIRYTGNVLNPELDIKATYQGIRTMSDSTGAGQNENVVVTFAITGTRLQPKADVSMTINGVDYYNYHGLTSNDVQTDAIQFIVYGSFPLSTAQRSTAQRDISTALGGSILTGATSLLTGTLSEFLRNNTDVIRSIEFSLNQGAADIRLSGVAWNGLWRYGGKILDDPVNNADFSILYSFGSIFKEPSLRNFMFELERKVETNTLSPTYELKRTNSARLFYRFSF